MTAELDLAFEDLLVDDSPELAQVLRARRVGLRLATLTWAVRRLRHEAADLLDASGAGPAYEALKVAEPASVCVVAAHPSFGSWSRLTARLLDRRAHVLLPDGALRSHLGALGWFALAAAIVEGSRLRLTVPCDASGDLRLPGTGLTVSRGPENAGRWLEVGVAAGGLDGGGVVLRSDVVLAPGVELDLHPPFLDDPPAVLDDPEAARVAIDRGWQRFSVLSPTLARLAQLDGLVIHPCHPVRGALAETPGVVELDVSLAPDALAAVLASAVTVQRTVDLTGEPPPVGSAEGERFRTDDDDLAALCRDLGCPDGVPINQLRHGRLRTDPTIDHLSLLWVRDRRAFDAVVQRLDQKPDDDIVACLLKGHVDYVQGDFTRAARRYARIVEAVPSDVDAWRDFSFCLRHLGHRRVADTWLFEPALVMDRLEDPVARPVTPEGGPYHGLEDDPRCAALIAALEWAQA